jgi:hypothetical protein
MPRKDKRTPREKAADYQIENMRKHFPKTFEFNGDTVTMPVKSLRERLGFAYNHGELDMRARVEAAVK